MQHLLDFIHDHIVEEQLYLLLDTPAGELEVVWRRLDGMNHWQLRPKNCEGPWERVHRADLLAHLAARHVDMAAVEQELHGLVATQIVFADLILRDAHRLLGSTAVRHALSSYREFVALLQASVMQLIAPARPSLAVVPGEAAKTPSRSGHLTIIR
jgi:hypothetical protein